MHENYEKSYSAPFSSHLYSKETVNFNNIDKREYPRLLYKGNHNKYSNNKPSISIETQTSENQIKILTGIYANAPAGIAPIPFVGYL